MSQLDLFSDYKAYQKSSDTSVKSWTQKNNKLTLTGKQIIRPNFKSIPNKKKYSPSNHLKLSITDIRSPMPIIFRVVTCLEIIRGLNKFKNMFDLVIK